MMDGYYYDPEFVGVIPIHQDIEVLPADEPKQLKLNWVVRETIGMAVINTKGVSKISIGDGRKRVVIGH